MSKLNFYSILIITLGLFACKTQRQQPRLKEFTVDVTSLKADTVITSAVYLKERILCLQADNKMFVLDTALQKDNDLTTAFSSMKIDFLHPMNDTVFIGWRDSVFFIDQDFTVKSYNRQPFKYGLPYYNDDRFYVHACSAGEFGAAVFFWDKQANKTYSYPATTVQQVLKFGETYVVSNFLAHMSGFSDYLFINDPTKLYQLKGERQINHCNWYMDVDSIRETKLFSMVTPPGVKYYADSITTRTLTTFTRKNKLYSIYCTDSATILAKFQNSKLIPIDTLIDRRLTFHNAKTHLSNNVVVAAYEATWAQGDYIATMEPYQNTGLILIRNSRITFLDFDTPHKWTGHY